MFFVCVLVRLCPWNLIKSFPQCCVCNLFRNSTYCMKVSMSMTVEEKDEGRCFSSKIRHLEKAEITHSKMITCPDIEDYLAPYKQPQMTWYKVRHTNQIPVTVPKSSVDRWNLIRLCLFAGVRAGWMEKVHHCKHYTRLDFWGGREWRGELHLWVTVWIQTGAADHTAQSYR